MTTPEDAAAVTQETARVMEGLEALRHEVTDSYYVDLIDAAIDRLIVLDHAQTTVKDSLTPHPRQLAEKQDAVLGNFRNNDEQSDGA